MNGISVFESEDKFNNTTISKFGMDGEVESLYNILIEIDEHLSQFLGSLKVGSIFSLAQLFSHATKYECDHCQNIFYSSKLHEEHILTHSFEQDDKNVTEMLVTKHEEELESDSDKIQEDQEEAHVINILNPSVSDTIDHQYSEGDKHATVKEEDKQKVERKACPYCGSKFRVDKLDYHIRIRHTDRLDTEMEDLLKLPRNSMERNKKLEQTIIYNEETMMYVCNMCDKEFESKKKLLAHRNNHIRIMKRDRTRKKDLGPYKPIRCPECNFSVPRNTTLERHMILSHYEVKPCQFCEKTFTNVKDFRQHENTHMQSKYKKPCTCEICGAVLGTKGNLKVHIETVHCDDKESLKKHCCDICGHKFRSSDKLRDHVNIHNNIKPYKCPDCDKTFTNSRRLKDHYRQHTGEPIGCCNECGKTFLSWGSMRDHQAKYHPDPSRPNKTSNDYRRK